MSQMFWNIYTVQNVSSNSPECIGMDGLLEAYRDALSRIELAGPTEFGPTVRHAARQAASLPPDGSRYCVLLIITDGVISDMNKAKEEIVKANFFYSFIFGEHHTHDNAKRNSDVPVG